MGAELRGTGPVRWHGLAPGSGRDLGYFRVTPASPTSIVLCESAIDALSCYLLHPGCSVISTSGARANPRWLAPLLKHTHGLPVYCGFDADPTGDQQAKLMMTFHSTVHRLHPSHHDWNDVLQATAVPQNPFPYSSSPILAQVLNLT